MRLYVSHLFHSATLRIREIASTPTKYLPEPLARYATRMSRYGASTTNLITSYAALRGGAGILQNLRNKEHL